MVYQFSNTKYAIPILKYKITISIFTYKITCCSRANQLLATATPESAPARKAELQTCLKKSHKMRPSQIPNIPSQIRIHLLKYQIHHKLHLLKYKIPLPKYQIHLLKYQIHHLKYKILLLKYQLHQSKHTLFAEKEKSNQRQSSHVSYVLCVHCFSDLAFLGL